MSVKNWAVVAESSPTEAAVPGSIPGVKRNFFCFSYRDSLLGGQAFLSTSLSFQHSLPSQHISLLSSRVQALQK